MVCPTTGSTLTTAHTTGHPVGLRFVAAAPQPPPSHTIGGLGGAPDILQCTAHEIWLCTAWLRLVKMQQTR